MEKNIKEVAKINKMRAEGKTLSEIATTINKSISYVLNRTTAIKKQIIVSPDLLNTLHNHRLVNTIKKELNSQCQICEAKDISLDLHHKYIKLKPYKKVLIFTLLCKSCHNSQNKKEVKYRL